MFQVLCESRAPACGKGPCQRSSRPFKTPVQFRTRSTRIQHKWSTITRANQTVDDAKSDTKSDVQATTEKYGLEAGIYKALTNKSSEGKSGTEQAKELLAQYGSAYLITSISFAIISFSACYALVNSGVDVAALLSNIGIKVDQGSTGEQVGTVAIAYAAHKALSPVRFPPTVALTPVVAKWLGRKIPADKEKEK